MKEERTREAREIGRPSSRRNSSWSLSPGVKERPGSSITAKAGEEKMVSKYENTPFGTIKNSLSAEAGEQGPSAFPAQRAS